MSKVLNAIPEIKERDYALHFMFRSGRSIPEWKVFSLKGNLTDAIVEGRRHCSEMDLIFLRVRPFKVDLREQEQRKLENPDLQVESMI